MFVDFTLEFNDYWRDKIMRLNSSNLSEVAYDDATGTMTITFRSGATYAFSNVPKDTFEALCSSPSPGSFFARSIRNQYAGVQT